MMPPQVPISLLVEVAREVNLGQPGLAAIFK